jgi:hypothetical protein
MPKLKSHRGAAKRFKKTATGKFKRGERVQGAHPDQQGPKPEAQTEGDDHGVGPGHGEAPPDASLLG